MLTTRLSDVMTGCGGNDTTCSRRSTDARTRSMNGTSRCSPGSSVREYRPRRSTMIATACGTMRTALTSATMTKIRISARTTYARMVPGLGSFIDCLLVVVRGTGHPAARCGAGRAGPSRPGRVLRGQRRDDGGRAVEPDDAHLRPGGDLRGVRLGPRGPDLTDELHAPAELAHAVHGERRPPDVRGDVRLGERQARAQVAQEPRAQRDQQDDADDRERDDLEPERPAGRVHAGRGERSPGEHDEHEVERDDLHETEEQRRSDPPQPAHLDPRSHVRALRVLYRIS